VKHFLRVSAIVNAVRPVAIIPTHDFADPGVMLPAGIGLIFCTCAKWDCMDSISMSTWFHAAQEVEERNWQRDTCQRHEGNGEAPHG
jgi:hypothetical protein